MYPEDLRTLSDLRLSHAKECLRDAQTLLRAESYRSAANRAYYAIFHAMRAVLILDQFDSSKHSGIIAEFRRRYVATGIFSKEMSKHIGKASDSRNASDYNDFYIISKAETVEQVANAEEFVSAVEVHLSHLASSAKQ